MKYSKWDYLGGIDNHMEHYKKQYGILAKMYKRQTKEALLKMVPMKGKVVLEVGCENGFLGEIAKEMGITITYGADFTKSILKYAKGKYGKVMYSDVTKKLPFKDNSIDIVLLPEVIAHLENRSAGLKQVHRVLKTGGYLILSMPDRKYLDAMNSAKMLIKGHPLRKPNQYFEPMYSSELARLISNHGFKILKHYKTFHQSRQILLARKV